MNILLSNDDGYQAPGLAALNHALSDIAKLTIVAPEQNRSGASNSLTLDTPLRVTEVNPDIYYINGTPTDCVHVAITGLMQSEPDMVVAGINSAANLGDDTLYSGTVAAATEGRFLGLPAIAISLTATAQTSDEQRHFETAGQVAAVVIAKLQSKPLPKDTILNINVPDLPYDQLKGMKATRLGHRHKSEPVIRQHDPRGRQMFWIGPAGEGQDAGVGTDFDAIENGYVSITPLQVDITRHNQIPALQGWLSA